MPTFMLLVHFKLFHCQAILKLFPVGFINGWEESDTKPEVMLTVFHVGLVDEAINATDF